ncbi:MAG: hypothetical protein ABJE66_00100 [Deltaproteobacteria bacterium]
MTLIRLAVCFLAACGGGTSNQPAPQEVAVTPTGTAQGAPVSGVVTAAGGTLTSGDGLLQISIPAGAVATDTTLTIQPITNEAPGGMGTAYRLGPEGQTFAVPATLTFAYTDGEISASDAAGLGIAFQDSIGQWNGINQITLDEAAHTLAVQTPHFSDWSRLEGFQIRPPEKTLKLGESLELSVQFCSRQDDGDLTSLLYNCTAGEGETDLLTEQKWLVNGATADITAIDQTFGTITPSTNSTATYTAPDAAPPVNPIAVSTDFRKKHGGHVILVANITVGQPPIAGTIDSTIDDENGTTVVTHATAKFTWNDEILGYEAISGHFAVTYDSVSADCSVHGVGEADIGAKEGYIEFSGATEYFFGGESGITLNGTITCTGGSLPYTSSDPRQWWPSVMGTYKVHDDGSLSETVTHSELGLEFVDMTWSLSPQS